MPKVSFGLLWMVPYSASGPAHVVEGQVAVSLSPKIVHSSAQPGHQVKQLKTEKWHEKGLFCLHTHCSLLKSRGLFWWKWLLGQSVAALNFKSYWRAMEQSGADKNGMGGIPTSLGAQNTIQICRQMRLDLTIPNSLI